MSETIPTCRIHEENEWLKCDNPAMPGDSEGLCILHSQDKEKNQDDFKAALQARWQQEDQESYDFRMVFFPGRFDPREFFDSKDFGKPVNFASAFFTKGANFYWASFAEGANFYEASFAEEADFSKASFMKGANFERTSFAEGADYYEASFAEGADFRRAIFMKGANFERAFFAKVAYFSRARFMERANFIGARLEGADFSKVLFTEGAYFFFARFMKEANFSGAGFMKGAKFERTSFAEGVDFYWVTLGGQVVFKEINPKNNSEPSLRFRGNFQELDFQEQGRLRFQDVSLAHCSFIDTDLRHPEFLHVTWGFRGGRQVVYDEVKLRADEQKNPWFGKWFWAWVSGHLPLKTFSLEIGASTVLYVTEASDPPEPPWGDSYGQVERLYRYLKINYLTEQDYKNAGDFHYGEMEIHRRASKWRWFPFYWYNLYSFLSGYGERPIWALGWLAAFLVSMAGLVWMLGLEIGNPPHLAGFGDSFIYLLQKVTLQRPDWAEPAGFWGKLVAGFSVLFIPGQAALFLLALRNRLGRRR